jgi:hypothetical protein
VKVGKLECGGTSVQRVNPKVEVNGRGKLVREEIAESTFYRIVPFCNVVGLDIYEERKDEKRTSDIRSRSSHPWDV